MTTALRAIANWCRRNINFGPGDGQPDHDRGCQLGCGSMSRDVDGFCSTECQQTDATFW